MTTTSKGSVTSSAIKLKNYRNKVFNKDVLEILTKRLDNSLDMIYDDPDYNVGVDYSGKKYTQKWKNKKRCVPLTFYKREKNRTSIFILKS